MCGIVGYYNWTGVEGLKQEKVLSSMRDVLIHRGPDDSGLWIDVNRRIGLAHRRLSIVDLSNAGRQPMISKSGRFVIVFNGEIYNHREIRISLEQKFEISWESHSDTETLLISIELVGLESTLRSAVGMFAIVVWDNFLNTISLARDRMGEKPLYYGWQNNVLLFGSELKAIKLHPEFENLLNKEALPQYLRHGYIPAPATIWKGIYKLLPGTFITFNDSSINQIPSPVAFWSMLESIEKSQRNVFQGTEIDAINELERLLSDTIEGQKLSDVPIGAFLSGGIDSSTIVAIMQAHSDVPVKTFTIGFSESAYNEAEHAKLISSYLGTDHHELVVSSQEALDVVSSLASIFDEPFADVSAIPTLLLAKLASRHVTVSLSGDAGDELFGGYKRYSDFQSWRKLISVVPTFLRKPISSIVKSPVFGFSEIVRRRQEVLAGAITSVNNEELYRILSSHWLDGDDVLLDKKETQYWLNSIPLGFRLNDDVDHVMLADSITYLPDDILVKVDRAAMSASLETRVPLLDHRIVEWSLSLPQSLKTRGGHMKWVLRNVLYKYVPKELIERPKMGFGAPIGLWLRGSLKDWAEDLLDPTKMKDEGLFNVDVVQQRWREHKLGIHNWEHQLWDVLMFQAWLRLNNPVKMQG